MKILEDDFNIPRYLLEDILEYVGNGKPSSKWPNLYTLIRVAENNNRFTNKQAETLIDMLKSK